MSKKIEKKERNTRNCGRRKFEVLACQNLLIVTGICGNVKFHNPACGVKRSSRTYFIVQYTEQSLYFYVQLISCCANLVTLTCTLTPSFALSTTSATYQVHLSISLKGLTILKAVSSVRSYVPSLHYGLRLSPSSILLLAAVTVTKKWTRLCSDRLN